MVFSPYVPATRDLTSGTAHPLTAESSGLQLRLWRPTSTTVVVHVVGDLDASSTPRLYELLVPRLTSTIETLVLDLSEVGFLGVAGLELLAHVRQRAASRSMAVCLVDGPVAVDRALRAAGWAETVPTYPSLKAAVAGLPGRAREGARAAG